MMRSILTLQLRAVEAWTDTTDCEDLFTALPGVLDAAIDPGSGTVRLEVDGRTFRFRRLHTRSTLRASDPAPQPAGLQRGGPSAALPIPGAPAASPAAGPA